MPKLFDQVRLLVDVPEEALVAGDVGYIIELYTVPEIAYEVEFCEKGSPETKALIALKADQFSVI